MLLKFCDKGVSFDSSDLGLSWGCLPLSRCLLSAYNDSACCQSLLGCSVMQASELQTSCFDTQVKIVVSSCALPPGTRHQVLAGPGMALEYAF